MMRVRFELTPLFGAGLLSAGVPFALMVWYIVSVPAFTRMFEDFGGVLPWLTAFAISPWWGPGLLALYVLAIPATLLAPSPRARDLALFGVVLAGLLLVMASAASLYLPLFQLAPISGP